MSARNPITPNDAPIFVESAVPSTMDAARSHAATGAVLGTLFIAHEQTGGRGRYGNRWSSPPGGLYLSMVIRPAPNESAAHWRTQTLPWLALKATYALHQIIAPVLPLDHHSPFGIKWPNDLYYGTKKLAGVLIESTAPNPHPARAPFAPFAHFSIVGLGLNLAQPPADLPPTATSLAQLGLTPLPPPSQWARRWREAFFAAPDTSSALRAAVMPHLLGLHQPVTIGWRPEEQTTSEKRQTSSGRLAGLGPHAEAILEDHQGKQLTVSEGHLLKWSTWSTVE